MPWDFVTWRKVGLEVSGVFFVICRWDFPYGSMMFMKCLVGFYLESYDVPVFFAPYLLIRTGHEIGMEDFKSWIMDW